MKKTLELLNQTLALMFLVAGCSFAQNPPVPGTYQSLYTELQNDISDFDKTIPIATANAATSNVLWSAELLPANANLGLHLIDATAGAIIELNALQSLGVKSVVVNMAFPVVNQDFYAFNGDPGDYSKVLGFYSNLAHEIHNRGLKMIVESAIMFTGSFSANSGFNLTGYYATLNDTQFVAARVKNVLAIAQQVGPDYINLNSEPDTDLTLSGRTSLYGSATAFASMNRSIISQVKAAGVTIPLGAGVGTWFHNGSASDYVSALLGAGIDFLDLHVYPVNFGYLPAMVTYTNMAQQAGKKVGIAEAWLSKESASELTSKPPAGDPIAADANIFARDPFSFWAPVDQAFLSMLAKFSTWKGLLYMSPFWTQYFFAYLDYNQVANLSAPEVTARANQAAAAALVANQVTSTGKFYSTLIGGGTGQPTQASTVNAASFATGNLAPDSLVSIFGSNLATGSSSATSLPLPTQILTTTATIKDSNGNQQPLSLIFVSTSQINAAIPPGLSSGAAVITISNQGTVVATSNVTLASVSPGLFTANQTGAGAPIAAVVTVHADGSQSSVLAYQGTGVGNFTPAPIDLGAASDQSVMVIYGTGIRGRSSVTNVTARVGNVNVPVFYAGGTDTAHFVGLDQVNIGLPHSLAGAGQVNLTLSVDGAVANTVTVTFK